MNTPGPIFAMNGGRLSTGSGDLSGGEKHTAGCLRGAGRRLMKGGLAFLFLSLLLLGGASVNAVAREQSYGRLINYVGIVRGASQRLVKLELMHHPDDALTEYIGGILRELRGEGGPYGLPTPEDSAYRQNLAELDRMWEQTLGHIRGYRSGAEDETALLALSEELFGQANDTVFAAEDYTARRSRSLLVSLAVMLGIMLMTWIFIFWAGSKRLLSLEVSNEKLSDLTRRDTLTGAYQPEAFLEAAQRLLAARGEAERYAVVSTDFTDFKYINDVFGYTCGDSILARYGAILCEGLGEGELCGRVSADIFVLLLRYGERGEVAERQRRADAAIADFMYSTCARQSLPTCCGICCVEDVVEALDAGELLERANFARKTVKKGAASNYVYYNESIRRRLWEERDIEGRMLTALEHSEFVVYYQPKIDLRTNAPGGCEALVRWRGQDGALIPPDRFIPVFESRQMIGRLDRYVFEEVCRWLRRLLDEGLPALPVSVNVSRLQFYEPDFVARYAAVRGRYGIPSELLEIEFTESIVFDNAGLLLQIVHDLKSAGFACSIDDFGKGYSSLSLLKGLPVDVLKIDSLFFEDGDDRERDRAIVLGVVELARKLHIRSVAEGIETREQVEYLRQIGCDYVQGYYFYRPMPGEELERILREKTQTAASG